MGVEKLQFSEEKLREMKRSADARSVAEIVFVQMSQTDQINDVTISEYPSLFPIWDANWTGKAGTILQDGDSLYRSIHDVGAGQNTKPSDTPAMWTRIGDPTSEWPEWIQPIGSHDAYSAGAKVTHKEKHWISDVSGNVWEPSVYGWAEGE